MECLTEWALNKKSSVTTLSNVLVEIVWKQVFEENTKLLLTNKVPRNSSHTQLFVLNWSQLWNSSLGIYFYIFIWYYFYTSLTTAFVSARSRTYLHFFNRVLRVDLILDKYPHLLLLLGLVLANAFEFKRCIVLSRGKGYLTSNRLLST